MRRLALAASVVTIAAAVVHCSATTELVVAVDTDLVPSAELDTIHVAVDGPTGPIFGKEAEVRGASALPVTVGVRAGSNDGAEVVVVATALKDGVAVARTEVIARFVSGESRLVQVSLCKSCGLTCGRNLGTSLPEWNDSLPAKHACDTTFADSGDFDSGRGTDGAVTDALADSPVESTVGDAPFDAALCGAGCPANTLCKAQGCVVQSEPGCNASPIDVTGPRRISGKVCAATSPTAPMCADASALRVHAFVNATGAAFTAKLTAFGQTLRLNKVDSSCMQIGGNNCASGTNGTVSTSNVIPGQQFLVGFDGASGCADYYVEIVQ